ncbi:MAG: RNA polymerase sigma factor [Clostridiales bacterium]|nr:RNA polymerase sigma factor [Clostridiales bacterium]
MAKSLQRTDKEIAELYQRHVKTVYRVCFAYMKNRDDADDMVHDTFVKLIRQGCAFAHEEHEKAWLIRTASNLCKDNLRHWWRKREKFEDCAALPGKDSFEITETFQVIMGLPERYKTVIYMYYYEGYSGQEIAQALSKPLSTIYNHLHEAKTILRNKLGGDSNRLSNHGTKSNQAGPHKIAC